MTKSINSSTNHKAYIQFVDGNTPLKFTKHKIKQHIIASVSFVLIRLEDLINTIIKNRKIYTDFNEDFKNGLITIRLGLDNQTTLLQSIKK